jgi:hypothetical protein
MKNGYVIGTIENISLSGLFVVSDLSVKVMDRINVSIILPSDSGEIDIEADVVAIRVEKGGIALKYDPLGHKEFWTLQSYLYKLVGPSHRTH